MSHVTKVTIVGAAGNVGKHITAELLKTGKHDVTALTRPGSSSTFHPGLNVTKTTYEHSSLVAALEGQQALIITLAVTAPRGTQAKLIDAAADAGVEYVILNGWGFDSAHPSTLENPLAAPLLEAQRHVERLGKSAWINVVSGFWYEFSLGGTIDRFGFDFEGRKARIFDGGEAKANTSTWEQIGRAVAGLLSLKEKPDGADGSPSLSDYTNKCVYVSSFFISQNDMFKSVLRVTGTKESDWDVSHEKAADRFRIGSELWEKGDAAGLAQLLYAKEFIPGPDGELAMAFGRRNELLNSVLGLPEEDLDERTKVAIEIAGEARISGYTPPEKH